MKDRRRINKEWLLFLVLLLMGICLMQVAATLATRVKPEWGVDAAVESHLDPESAYHQAPGWTVEAIRPEILTPPAWNPNDLLTPEVEDSKKITVVPPMAFKPSATPTTTLMPDEPTRTPIPDTPTPSPTPLPATDTLTPLPATATPTRTATITKTPTPTASATDINTPTQTLTNTSTVTKTPTITTTPQPKPTKKPKPTQKPLPTRKPTPTPKPK